MRTVHPHLSRRQALRLGMALGGIGLAHTASALPVTPHATLGPFYPVLKPLDQDADLTRVAGRDGRAQGELLHLAGRILDAQGAPLAGATIEIWQADSRGRYIHPNDPHTAAIDADFQGYGVQVTDGQGRYHFKTVKPAAYPLGRGMRTPHVHFQITAAHDRKVTQMFFPDEPLNDQDAVLRNVMGDRRLLFARIEPAAADLEPASKLALFDVVMGNV